MSSPLFELEDVAFELSAMGAESVKLADRIHAAVAEIRAQRAVMADDLAERGVIHNTPYAKEQWVEGGRG